MAFLRYVAGTIRRVGIHQVTVVSGGLLTEAGIALTAEDGTSFTTE